MDIHKPKPWHGWREFLKEYLIIVIGVLTALGAEAAVQNLHEQRLSAEARDAVRAEINLDLANLKRRANKQACVDRRLAELSDFISKAEAGQPFQAPLTIGGPGRMSVYTQRWEAATAGGRTSLLSTDEQRDFARVYESLKAMDKYQEKEVDAWGELQGLEGVRRPSAEVLARARGALGEARMADGRIHTDLAGAEDRAAEIGIKGEDPHLIRSRQVVAYTFCLPISTAPADRPASARGPKG
jgi:hypothetical protein